MKPEVILITGANGQIGTVLSKALADRFGEDNIITTDIQAAQAPIGHFELLNIMDRDRLDQLITQYQVTQIYHLVAVLSATGEAAPLKTWQINMEGLFNVLEASVAHQISKLFFPSSIAVFGDTTPKDNTPQHTVVEPTTVYGISKAAAEDWVHYYYKRHGLDIRSLRLPGIIGHQSMPGGGTTDYAVEIYHHAVQGKTYHCFLEADTRLPMLYMPDTIQSILQLMDAPKEQINVRTSYNLSGMAFTPAEVAASIRRHFPDFKIQYQPDFRQAIAESWNNSIDDTPAREDWGWSPQYDLDQMTDDMIHHLSLQYKTSIKSIIK